jgi:hypothetical protein
MKKRNFSRKLTLKKHTIATLQNQQMNLVKAGADDPSYLPNECPTIKKTCSCPTVTECMTVCPNGPYC